MGAGPYRSISNAAPSLFGCFLQRSLQMPVEMVAELTSRPAIVLPFGVEGRRQCCGRQRSAISHRDAPTPIWPSRPWVARWLGLVVRPEPRRRRFWKSYSSLSLTVGPDQRHDRRPRHHDRDHDDGADRIRHRFARRNSQSREGSPAPISRYLASAKRLQPRSRGRPAVEPILVVGLGDSGRSLGVAGVDLKRAFERGPRLMVAVTGFLRA